MTEELDSDLEEYCREFENLFPFDVEICPKCGINLSKAALPPADWVKVHECFSCEEAAELFKFLRTKNICVIAQQNINELGRINSELPVKLLVIKSQYQKAKTIIEKRQSHF